MSIIYIIFHGVAAKYNDPVGVVRPPEMKLQAACFILARLAMICWLIAIIVACVVVSKPKMCMRGTQTCKLQVAEIVAFVLAL